MKVPSRKKSLLTLGGLVVLFAAGIGAFLSFGPPGLYAKSSSPEFCAGCHVMESQYENWFHNAGHRRIKCIDCHLPNDNFGRHIAWKGVTGMWDVYAFYSGHVPETITISQKGAEIVQENCRRCHEEIVSKINEDGNCRHCHRRLSHRTSGTF